MPDKPKGLQKATCDMCDATDVFTLKVDAEPHCIACLAKYQTLKDAFCEFIIAEVAELRQLIENAGKTKTDLPPKKSK